MDTHTKVKVLLHLRRNLMPLLLAALACSAGWAAPDEPLPKAEDILDKFVEVTGGKAAYENIRNEKWTGNFEFVGKGIKGTITSYRADPNKSVSNVEVEGIGAIKQGTDGQTAWESSPVQGPRIKQGEERAVALREATLRGPLYWRKLYKHVETVSQETIDDQVCYKVVLTPEEGKPETQYYSKKSGLMVKMTSVESNPAGEIPIETMLSEYKEENGLRQPHKMRHNAMGQDFLITIDRFDYNVDIPANTFDVPADVKALPSKLAPK
jgi:hypothetical protein